MSRRKRTIKDLQPWQQKLHEVIFGYTTPAGKVFDILLLWAILLSVLAVMLESVKSLNEEYGRLFLAVEWTFTVLFSFEYIARILSTPHPKKYVLSFMGLIDLLSILPSFLGLFIVGSSSLMVIRSIRLIRVFRVLKLTHFMGGANQIGNALYNSRYKITVFLGTVVCITIIMGTVMFLVEGPENGFENIPHSIYWAVVTVTTVGYGDITPSTTLGQALASLLMIAGYAIIAVPSGIVTAEMMNARNTMEKCPECDAQMSVEGQVFCHICGTKLPGQELK